MGFGVSLSRSQGASTPPSAARGASSPPGKRLRRQSQNGSRPRPCRLHPPHRSRLSLLLRYRSPRPAFQRLPQRSQPSRPPGSRPGPCPYKRYCSRLACKRPRLLRNQRLAQRPRTGKRPSQSPFERRPSTTGVSRPPDPFMLRQNLPRPRPIGRPGSVPIRSKSRRSTILPGRGPGSLDGWVSRRARFGADPGCRLRPGRGPGRH